MALFKKKIFDENNKIIKHKNVKLGVAFGGGALRGIGHLGVVKAFEELGIVPDYIAGTSAGSMVGALYAAGYTSSEMISALKKLKTKDIRDSRLIWKPSDSGNIEEVLKKIFGKDLMFSELKIPLTIVAVDIVTGKQVNITSGSVARASSGSCAVPGVFSPVVYNEMHLVDGGLTCTVPADVVRSMGANQIIAIEVNKGRGQGTDSLKLIDVLKSSLGIIMQANVEKTLDYADLVLKPELEKFSASKLGDIDSMVQEGYDVVMEHKDEIIKMLTKKPRRKINKLWQKLSKARKNAWDEYYGKTKN